MKKMNNEVRDKLKELVATYGSDEISTNMKRTEGFLRDYCGNHKLEITVLISTMKHKIPEEINAKDDSINQLKISRFVKRIQDNEGTVEEYAKWAVESWVVALGKEADKNHVTTLQTREVKGENEARRKNDKVPQLLSQMLDASNITEDTRDNVGVLVFIAEISINNGKYDLAAQLLSQALEAVNIIENIGVKVNVLAEIAGKYFESRQKDTAFQLLSRAIEDANAIEDKKEKANVLTEIAGKYFEYGQKDKVSPLLSRAFEVANAIEDVFSKGYALSKIAQEYAKYNLAEALDVANTIENVTSKNEALEEIAGKYAENGQFNKVIEVTNTIENKEEKSEVLAEIAVKHSGNGQKDMASQLLLKVIEAVDTIGNKEEKAKLLVKIAGKYIENGQKDMASQLLLKSVEAANAIENADDKIEVLAKIAVKYFKNGLKDEASVLLSSAVEVANVIEDADDKANALSGIADLNAEYGLLNKALEIANSIEESFWKTLMLAEIAGYYTEKEQTDMASQMLSQAIETANSINICEEIPLRMYKFGLDLKKCGRGKAGMFVRIADKYTAKGQKDMASQLLSKAIEVTDEVFCGDFHWQTAGMDDESEQDNYLNPYRESLLTTTINRANALAEIAVKYAENGQFDQAIKMVKKIYNTDGKDNVLVETADKYAHNGQFKKAFETAITIENLDDKAVTLLKIACMYAKDGKNDFRIWLFSKAATLAEIAVKCAENGQKDMASKLLSKTIEAANAIEDARCRIKVLEEIAGKYFEKGLKDTASLVLSKAIEVANTIEDLNYKDYELYKIAEMCVENGQFNKAIEVAITIESVYEKNDVLKEITVKYAQNSQFAKVFETVNKIEGEWEKVATMKYVARNIDTMENPQKRETGTSNTSISANATSERKLGEDEQPSLDSTNRAAKPETREINDEVETESGASNTYSKEEKLRPTEASYTDSVTGMEFVFVTGGSYQMGDTFGDGYTSEQPVHEVCVDNFYISKYAVTQGQWEDMMGSNPSHFNKGRNYPVEQVNWNHVQEFIKKVNKKAGKSYRLPTEAEWEYAARSCGKREKYAGTSCESELDQYAWYRCNSDNSTHPVGQKKPNGLGLYDMSGNVWEWCSDWYDNNYYSETPINNPIGPESGSHRLIRGGGWYYRAEYCRTSNRDNISGGYYALGFRLVLPQTMGKGIDINHNTTSQIEEIKDEQEARRQKDEETKNMKPVDLTSQSVEGVNTNEKVWCKARSLNHIILLLNVFTIEEAHEKAMVLVGIAGKYAENGQIDIASQLLFLALETTNTIKDVERKANMLREIASKHVENGQKVMASQILSQALEATNTIKDVERKANMLREIAGKYIENGQQDKASQLLSQAFEAAKIIECIYGKPSELEGIAREYAKNGQFDKAIETVNTPGGGFGKKYVIGEIAIKYAKSGQFSQAIETANTIEDADTKAKALTKIAVKCSENRQTEMASQLLSKASANAIKGNFKDDRLLVIVPKYAEIGQFPQAIKTANKIEDASKKAEVLTNIAFKYAESGQFSQAIETVNTIEMEWKKAEVLTEIAGKYTEDGQNEMASQLLSQAVETTNKIKFDWMKAGVLSGIAVKYAENGQKETSSQLFSQAIETVNKIDGTVQKIEPLLEIAGKYIENGQDDMASQLLSQAINKYQSKKYYFGGEEYMLAKIPLKFAENGQYVEAIETASLIKDASIREGVLGKIAVKCAESGQLSQAIKTAKTIKYDDRFKTEALVGIACCIIAIENLQEKESDTGNTASTNVSRKRNQGEVEQSFLNSIFFCSTSKESIDNATVSMSKEYKVSSQPDVVFRNKSLKLSCGDIEAMLKKYDFCYKSGGYMRGGFTNSFQERTLKGRSVIIDNVSGLMWMQGASIFCKLFKDVGKWIEKLNRKGYGGFQDWRLPTLEEAMSLMEEKERNGHLYIDPLFRGAEQIWTCDSGEDNLALLVNFRNGECGCSSNSQYRIRNVNVRAVRSITKKSNTDQTFMQIATRAMMLIAHTGGGMKANHLNSMVQLVELYQGGNVKDITKMLSEQYVVVAQTSDDSLKELLNGGKYLSLDARRSILFLCFYMSMLNGQPKEGQFRHIGTFFRWLNVSIDDRDMLWEIATKRVNT